MHTSRQELSIPRSGCLHLPDISLNSTFESTASLITLWFCYTSEYLLPIIFDVQLRYSADTETSYQS